MDSVKLSVCSKDCYSKAFITIKPNDSVILKVPNGLPEPNLHDISIEIIAYVDGLKPIISPVNYNDLTSTLNRSYKYIIDDSLKIKMYVED